MENFDEFSSTVELQVDAQSGHLGPPKEITPKSATTSYRELQIARCGVRGKVVHLQHGKYNGKPASLICFKLHFIFESNSSRFVKAEVRVSFDRREEKSQAESLPSAVPIVMKFQPTFANGRVTEVKESKTISASLPIGSISAIGYENTEEFSRMYSMQIEGMPWCEGDSDIENMVIWKVRENSKQANGIPHELDLALVVQHDGMPFHCVVKIVTWTKSGIRLFGWPWPKPNPLLFNSASSIGSSLDVSTFDELTDKHWKMLISFLYAISKAVKENARVVEVAVEVFNGYVR